MKNNNQNAYSAGNKAPSDSHEAPSSALVFSEEALAHCLADLKRQLELRQAMH